MNSATQDLQRDSPWFQPEGIPAIEPEADHTFDYEPAGFLGLSNGIYYG